MCSTEYISVYLLVSLSLTANELIKGCHSLLNHFYDMLLECLEVSLDVYQVLAVIVLLENLFVEAMVYTALEHIWVLSCGDLAS